MGVSACCSHVVGMIASIRSRCMLSRNVLQSRYVPLNAALLRDSSGYRFMSSDGTRTYTGTVLYDGGCPLCVWEISHYRKLDAQSQIRWVNLHDVEAKPELASIGVSKEAALQALHVIDQNGGLHVGVDAFPAMWERLPWFRALAAPWRGVMANVPGARRIVEFAYRKFVNSQLRRWAARRGVQRSAMPRLGTAPA